MEPTVCLVYITAPSLDSARGLAHSLLQARLIACANLLPGIESHYRWQGKLESSAEVLVLAKTHPRHRAEIESFVRAAHPYDIPCITFYEGSASADFSNWVRGETDRGVQV